MAKATTPPQPQPTSAPATPAAVAPTGVAVLEMTSLYKAFIWINAIICGLCFLAMLLLAAISTKDATEQMRSASTTVETVFKMTAGAFLGLLAGRGAAPDRVQSP